MSRAAPLETITRYYDGCSTGDVDTIRATLHPNVVHYFLAPNPGSTPVAGAEHLTRYWRKVAQLIEARWVVDHCLAGPEEAAIEWTMFWRPHDSQHRVVTRGAEWFTFAGGLIREIRSYYQQQPATTELDGFPYAARGYSVPGSETSTRHEDGRAQMRRRAHLAVQVCAPGLDADEHVRFARLALDAGVDFMALPDSFAPPPDGQPSLDAVAIAARIAPAVPGLALVPTVTTTHTEPFHLSKAIATLDFVTGGRAGVEISVSRTAEEAELFGRKRAAPPEELWAEAGETIEVMARLWDSWEDDAVIRDAATGRYVDRDKLHYIDFTGEFFSVKGPSITPRSPQAHPLVVVRADESDALPVAARWADVVRFSAPDVATAHRVRHAVRGAVAAVGRDPDNVAVLLDVEFLVVEDDPLPPPASVRVRGCRELADLFAEAVDGGAADGVTVIPLPVAEGLQGLADDAELLLVRRGVRTPADRRATLRERFRLPRPANHFVTETAR